IRQPFVKVLGVLHHAEGNLLEIAHARSAAGIFPRTREDREQNRRQNCDDRYYDQQFDESKGASVLLFHWLFLHNAKVVLHIDSAILNDALPRCASNLLAAIIAFAKTTLF